MTIIIGIKINGPAASGKTTWLNEIASQLKKEGFSIYIDHDIHQLCAVNRQ